MGDIQTKNSYVSNSSIRNLILIIAVIVTAVYFFKVAFSKPSYEKISLPEVKIVNTNIQLDNETIDKLNEFQILLETVKIEKDTTSLIKLKFSIKVLDSIFFNKSKQLNAISKTNMDSIVNVLNKKIAEINDVQNNIATVKEDYEYRTDLYQSLILFIAAIIGFFGYSNFKDIELKSKEIAEKIAEKRAEQRVGEFTDENISDIVSIKTEEKVEMLIGGIMDQKFNDLSKNYEGELEKLISEKLESNVQIENDEITNMKAEIKELKRRISELEK